MQEKTPLNDCIHHFTRQVPLIQKLEPRLYLAVSSCGLSYHLGWCNDATEEVVWFVSGRSAQLVVMMAMVLVVMMMMANK